MQHVINYLNEKMEKHKITFSVNKNDVLSLNILDGNTIIEFDDDVRDILALDKTKSSGMNKFTANGVLSLTRRINRMGLTDERLQHLL